MPPNRPTASQWANTFAAHPGGCDLYLLDDAPERDGHVDVGGKNGGEFSSDDNNNIPNLELHTSLIPHWLREVEWVDLFTDLNISTNNALLHIALSHTNVGCHWPSEQIVIEKGLHTVFDLCKR
jgi:hypothetical protein